MSSSDRIFLNELKVHCIIGIFPWERRKKQPVLIDLDFPIDTRKSAKRDRIEDAVDYKRIAKSAIRFVEKSRFQLLETLAEELAGHLLVNFPIPQLHLKVSKPGAIRGSRNVGVEILREGADPLGRLAYLGLGSNVNPGFHLANAVGELSRCFTLRSISHVYETSPVGGRKGQPPFWNLVLSLERQGTPEGMKRFLNLIEKKEGRVPNKDPMSDRTLDLDLLLWGEKTGKKNGISLPHRDLFRRAFVIYPLLEIAPLLKVPGTDRSIVELAAAFPDRSQKIQQLFKLAIPD
jgi:2-amino-4-hydroxy-6-hydroxymethyldihydropteridine diphosphokinase